MKIFKRITAVFIAALFSVSISLTVFADDMPKVVVDARNSVVRMYAYSGGEYSYTGTGFVIARDGDVVYIVTNYHVIADTDNGKVTLHKEVSIVNKDRTEQKILVKQENITTLKDDDGNSLDLAILKVDDKRLMDYPALPLRSAADVAVGEAVYALGFPGASDDALADGANLPSTPDDVTPTYGNVSKPDMIFNPEYSGLADAEHAIQHTATINHGNSGGPLLDKYGNVIGVNTWGWDNADLYYAGHSDYIIDAAKSMDIAITIGKKPDESTSETTTAEESVTTAETAVTTATADESGSDGEITETDSSENGIPVIPIIIAIAVGIAVGVIVILKRKKKSAEYTDTNDDEAEEKASANDGKTTPILPAPSKVFAVVGTAGAYAGKRIEIRGKAVFGRQPGCTVTFPENAEGVSSVHCEFTVNGNLLMVTDKNSTYGTFVNKVRIAAGNGVTLKSGDKVGLGSNQTEFQVI
jgi:S1-C subfamily serine protease